MLGTIQFIVELILLAVGVYLLMQAKMRFQTRQKKTPDNQWSAEEQKLRKIGYALLILDVAIAMLVKL